MIEATTSIMRNSSGGRKITLLDTDGNAVLDAAISSIVYTWSDKFGVPINNKWNIEISVTNPVTIPLTPIDTEISTKNTEIERRLTVKWVYDDANLGADQEAVLEIIVPIENTANKITVSEASLPDSVDETTGEFGTPATTSDSILCYDASRVSGERIVHRKFSGDAYQALTGTGEFAGFIPSFDTVTDLRAIVPTVSNLIATTAGWSAAGDGGGGFWWRSVAGASPGTYTHNGIDTLVAPGGDGSAAWIIDLSINVVHAIQLGLIPNLSSDSSSLLNTIIAAMTKGGIIIIAPGTYQLENPITMIRTDSTLPANLSMLGFGAKLYGTEITGGYTLDLGSQDYPTANLLMQGLTVFSDTDMAGTIRISDIANAVLNGVRCNGVGIGALIRGGCYLSKIANSRFQGTGGAYFDVGVKIESSTTGNKPNSLKVENTWLVGNASQGTIGLLSESGGGACMESVGSYYEDHGDHGILIEDGWDFCSRHDTFEGCARTADIQTNRGRILDPLTGAGCTNGYKISGNNGFIRIEQGTNAITNYEAELAGLYGVVESTGLRANRINLSGGISNAYRNTSQQVTYGKHIELTIATSLNAYYKGATILNTNATAANNHTLINTGIIDIGTRISFSRTNASYVLRATPYGTDQILGSSAAGKYISLDAIGSSVTLEYVGSGKWQVIASHGTISFQA